jgi:Fe-S-cluster-containing dehydrogenase component
VKIAHGATCVGCKVCTIACSFGTINYVQKTGKVQKCDLCADSTGSVRPAREMQTGLERVRIWTARSICSRQRTHNFDGREVIVGLQATAAMIFVGCGTSAAD